MNESAASTTLKRIALFKVNKVPYLLEFNINWAAATHLTRVWSRWDALGKQAVSVARSGWRFPAQKLSKTRPLQQKPAQNFNCQNNVIWFYYHVNQGW